MMTDITKAEKRRLEESLLWVNLAATNLYHWLEVGGCARCWNDGIRKGCQGRLCESCNGTGYIIRSVWQKLREKGIKGALTGALIEHTRNIPGLSGKIGDVAGQADDCDAAALEVVLEVMG